MGWDHIRELVEAGRYRDAYDATEEWWRAGALPPELGTGELVLAGRLASRLGGIQMSRMLWREAQRREPDHPQVVVYARDRLDRSSSAYTRLKAYEAFPEVPGADPETQVHWAAGKVYLLSHLRDFRGAERALVDARERFGAHMWISLAAAELEYARDRLDAAETLARQVFVERPRLYANLHLMSRIAGRRHEVPTLLRRFESIRGGVQDIEIALLHVWYLVAQAERSGGVSRAEALRSAGEITQRYEEMVPLADRRTRERLAFSRLDVAAAQGDRPAMWREANRTRSRWHQRRAANLRRHPDGKRRVVPHVPVWQDRSTCLPCSVCTLQGGIDLHKLVRELTYAGTSVVACMAWLRAESALESVPFVATEDTVRRVTAAGIGFVYLTVADTWSHAMAAIGVDEAAGTLLIHDPSSVRVAQVLLEDLKLNEGPFGPQCVALVAPVRVDELRAIIPEADRIPYGCFLDFNEQLRLGDPDGAAVTLRTLAERFPDHPFVARMQASLAMMSGHLAEAVTALEGLLRAYPANAHVRADLIHALHRARNPRRQTEVYRELMQQGRWGETEATQCRRDPVYVARYADMIGLTGAGLESAASMLRISLRRSSGEAELWHILGDVLWRQGDLAGAWIPLKAASDLAKPNEHYARSLVDIGCNIGRLEQALEHLEERAREAGTAMGAGAPWGTWIEALAEFGFPHRAQQALAEALERLPSDADLLAFALQFQLDHGFPEQAAGLLPQVRELSDRRKARQAEAKYLQANGRPRDALELLEAELAQHPSDVDVARQVAHLLSGVQGTEVSLVRVRDWAAQYTDDEAYEDLLYETLRDQHRTDEADALIQRRLQRNPQNAWAWIEWGHAQVSRLEMAPGEERAQRLKACAEILEQVLIFSFPNATRTVLEARFALASGDRDRAWVLLLEALRLDANRYDALSQATRLICERQREERLPAFEALLSLLRDRGSESPAIPDFFRGWAETFGLEDALQRIRAWREVRPDSQLLGRTEVRMLLDVMQSRAAATLALDLLDELTERFPQSFHFAMWRAEALRGLNDTAGMRQAYRDLLQRFPLHHHTREQLADAVVREGEIDEAVALLRDGVTLQPQERESWQALANLLDRLGRQESAVEVLSDAVSRMPRDIGLNEYLVDLLLDLDRDAEAVDHARLLAERFETGAYPWFILARALERTELGGSQEEVEGAYRRALRHDPTLHEAADKLARFLARNGRPREAVEVLEAFPDQAEYAAAIAGRRIWLQAQSGCLGEARSGMRELLRAHPDYLWGWWQLMDWLEEEKNPEQARDALEEIPDAVRHQIEWRVRRVQVLENCGVQDDALDREWADLVAEYPTHMRVVLTYVDRCIELGQWDAAEEWLTPYAAQTPNTPCVQARQVQVHMHHARTTQALDLAFAIWSRPGWDIEWADDAAWTSVAPVFNTWRVRRRFMRHLRTHGHLRPWLVDRMLRKCPPRLHGRVARLVRRHPDSQRLLPGLLEAYSDLGRHQRADRIWRRLAPAAQQDPSLWASGICISNISAQNKPALRRLRARLQGWQQREGVEMLVLANAIDAHLRNLNLRRSRTRVFAGEDRAWLETVIELADHALHRLRFDHSAQYVGRSYILALLALGRVEEAATIYREFEHLLLEENDDFWHERTTRALAKHLPELIPAFEKVPLSLQRIAPSLKAASASPDAPIAAFGACVKELRRRPDVEDRKTRVRLRRNWSALLKNPELNPARKWWLLALVIYIILQLLKELT